MFADAPFRLYGLPPGADFPAELVRGLLTRMRGQPPEALARVTLLLNTTRMQRRVLRCLADAGAGFLPRLRLVADLGAEMPFARIPAAVPPLRRRLELTVLIDRLLQADPSLAPRAALYDLADSLARLMDEMRGEGVPPEAIARLDVSSHSDHWARTQRFLAIVETFFAEDTAPDIQTRQRLVVEALVKQWSERPPQDPVIVAGSTGSRGTTALLMRAVARLPQGAIVLPGFDFDMAPPVWDSLSDALTAEDHPQYRFRRLFDLLGVPPAVQPWHDTPAPSSGRNRLISLSLRPAPVTDQWLTEGTTLPDLRDATAGMTLVEAPGPRAEALAIALILREAADTGTSAALVTPDRDLARQVTAALDRWRIRPDDSAGRPLALTAPGRLFRQVADLFGRRIAADALLALLKHPLAFSGSGRGDHLRLTRDLELHIRRHGPAFPGPDALMAWAAARRDAAMAVPWSRAVGEVLAGLQNGSAQALSAHVTRHRAVVERLARGTDVEGTGALWSGEAGAATRATLDGLQAEAAHGGTLTAEDYCDLFTAVLSQGEVREGVVAHPKVMIWGTIEARVQGAELVILGGLNDGTWPASPPPDPWLNRAMRREAGLLLPERQIGLAAHDYQQAVGAPKVVLTRALRNAEAETVPSRWLNRLMNLMGGLSGRQHGPEALEAMRARGRHWLDLARAMEAVTPVAPARRPSPRPPLATRPKELSLTRIERLIRDPYAIYARYVLRLSRLNSLRASPDARLRGEALHRILETFVKERPQAGEDHAAAKARLLSLSARILAEEVPWPTARALWLARMVRAADQFLAFDAATGGAPVALERAGAVRLDPLDFTLIGTPDRIDLRPDGRLHLIDYKTGDPPSQKKQEAFEKQLLLAAVMAERGGFAALGPREVARITYFGLKPGADPVETVITPDLTGKLWEDLHRLIGRYLQEGQGYTSRRAMFETDFPGDYDHLARFGEWDLTDPPHREEVGHG